MIVFIVVDSEQSLLFLADLLLRYFAPLPNELLHGVSIHIPRLVIH